MRHPIEGTPYVPPNPICPAEQEGSLPDLTVIPFQLNIDVHSGRTHFYAVFGNADTSEEDTGIYDADFVETAMPAVPSNSELAQQLHVIIGLEGVARDQEASASAAIPNNEHPAVERMRSAFCERVANCRGVVGGQCWALGASAVEEVVKGAVNDRTDGPKPTSSDKS